MAQQSTDFVDAYDADTGDKLPRPVPKRWLEKGSPFPNLRATPASAARAAKNSAADGGADSKEKK